MSAVKHAVNSILDTTTSPSVLRVVMSTIGMSFELAVFDVQPAAEHSFSDSLQSVSVLVVNIQAERYTL